MNIEQRITIEERINIDEKIKAYHSAEGFLDAIRQVTELLHKNDQSTCGIIDLYYQYKKGLGL